MSQGFEIKFAVAKPISPARPQLREVSEIQALQQNLVQHFADIKDPRVERTLETSTHRYPSDCNERAHRRSARVGRHRELWH